MVITDLLPHLFGGQIAADQRNDLFTEYNRRRSIYAGIKFFVFIHDMYLLFISWHRHIILRNGYEDMDIHFRPIPWERITCRYRATTTAVHILTSQF